ncbi:hypothetical protein LZ554_003923 [Drepanopeziza brunnea f. sp. 'monogermtubi']|nr:hypothetical protein LZ554_003923 [Drepanopeziza brunnea f. sp. 'monogermtubi']
MQSFENLPLSASRRIGASINTDTGSKGNRREIPHRRSPSRRETSRPTINTTFAAGRALNVRSDPRETFLDDITPIDSVNRGGNERESGGARRDSHDLSLSPRQVTRDSLVDNMLMSFDQFAYRGDRDVYGGKLSHDESQLYATFADQDSYQPTQNFASRNGHGAGHTYSFSSDFDVADDLSRRPGGPLSRERRSMSSSNFQSSIGRVNSFRKDGTATFSGSRAPPPPQVPHRVLHTRSGKGSKGNSATSFELGYAQGTGNQRWVHGQAGRSSSFDCGSDRVAMNVTSHTGPRQIEAMAPSFNQYDYDAAPTPTIPVGPRRIIPPSAAMVPVTDSVQPEPPQKPERKRSTRSSKSGYKGRLGANHPARFDHGLIDRSRELPPMPAFTKEPVTAPAPQVGGGKSKEQGTTRAQPKERPGFFRRVFGSRSSPVAPTASPPSHGSTTSAETTHRPCARPQHIGTQIKAQHTHSPPEVPPSPPPREQAHVLTKRPSSFFRRRKKSVREPEPPVPMVPHFTSQIPEREPSRVATSPVSSLRTVMNPYLKTPARIPAEIPHHAATDRQMSDSPEPNDRTVRGFSPDYDPDRSATIRAVRPVERYSTDNLSVLPPPQQTPASTSQTGISSQGSSKDVGHANFLPNSSDNDPGTNSTPNSVNGPEKKWFAEQTPLPPSVSRQIALVADYERAYSRRSPSATKPEMGRASPVIDAPRSPISSNSSIKQTSMGAEAPAKEEEWVMLTPEKLGSQQDVQENRVYLEASSSSSEEDDAEPASGLLLTPEELRSSIVSGSTETAYKSATSLPILQIEGREESASPSQKSRLLSDADSFKPFDPESTVTDETLPSEGDRDNARKIYDGNEDFILKERAAAWLGEDNPIRLRTLVAYMELYNFTNLNILAALRLMCGKLVLKAESQQVDRILINFSKRWCQCNPSHGFKGIDIVHTICYSILLLNTDLHLADIDQKMTRSQFIKNTMPTVRRSVADLPPDTFDPSRPSILPGKGSTFDSIKSDDSCPASTEKYSVEVERPSWRASFKPAPRVDSDGTVPTPLDYDTPVDDCGPLVKAPFHGTLRTWEVQVEIVLKDFYNSIRSERLPLFGATTDRSLLQAPSSNSLSLFTNGVLRRSPSVLSKAPSEAQSYVRGRTAETLRVGNGKWSIWTINLPCGAHLFQPGDYQQSIGFANALSQAIIREETIGSAGSGGSERGEYDESRVAPLLEDESLELHGAPWAKEGIVKHKHHLEALDKKAKDRNWNEVFAVIEKGYMSLFSFSSKSKSKGKAVGGVVGGGNWQENAKSLGSFLLRQTIASALPSPGYSKARPHVWALSLPTGAVHLFQVGTPDIVKEFVSTANYWSARLSNHPLVGGICNIEYGWSDAIVNNSLVHAINESTRPSTRHSMQSSRSLRSSVDHTYGTSFKARLPGDKITISDWTPPTQSMRASNLMEADQLRTLSDYVAGIEEELQKHNELRSPMLLAFTPRHPNSQKAMANWERKSSYLLREIVKFTTYIDCLQAAEAGKQAIYSERAERLLPEGNDDDSDEEANNTLRPE